MLDRLLGLETEYAIRFTPSDPDEVRRPGHDVVFETIAAAVANQVATTPGARKRSHQQLYVENGGALYYEYLPYAPSGGVVEASTPECRSPSELLLYQRASERMLARALPESQAELERRGWRGTLGLLKNCRDAEGHVYGAQENYEVEIARGVALLGYRLGLVPLIPLVSACGLVALATGLALALVLLVLLIVVAVGLGLWAIFVPRHAASIERLFEDEKESPLLRGMLLGLTGLEIALTGPGIWFYSVLFRIFCCRRIRRDTVAFLFSRPVFSGAGTFDVETGELGLSEKGPAMRRLIRTTSLPSDRSVFDLGHLVKALFSVPNLRIRSVLDLFSPRQRIQLGLSDSNMAQTAEYLKVGTTMLVLDMAEAGALKELPRLVRPMDALEVLVGDPELRATVRCTDGKERTALQLQRLYFERARRFVEDSSTPSLEAKEVVRLWRETLDALEDEPASLFGRIDWVTKRALIERAGRGLSTDAKKKIDLKYHELGEGYFARLEEEGLAPRLVNEAEAEAAIRTPPSDSPARRRSQLVRMIASEGVKATVSWNRVEISEGLFKKKVIRLADYRKKDEV